MKSKHNDCIFFLLHFLQIEMVGILQHSQFLIYQPFNNTQTEKSNISFLMQNYENDGLGLMFK